MTGRTHAWLAEMILPALRDEWGISFSRKAFVRGSVKPDQGWLFVRHPHFWKRSRSFLLALCGSLAGRSVKSGRKNRAFSEGLGIALHYAADFFTAVHNISPNNLVAHIEYENRLDALFRETLTDEMVRNTLKLASRSVRGRQPPDEDEKKGVHRKAARLLDERHSRYVPSRDHPERDIREILLVCMELAVLVIDEAAALSERDLAANRRNRTLPDAAF